MVLPNLIHPVNVIIQTLDTANTVYDENHREPIPQTSRNSSQTVLGQPKYFGREKEVDIGGKIIKATGYVLFRYSDLEYQSITLKTDDKITKIGKLDCVYYINGLTPAGHYTDQLGATMVKAFFNDKHPAQNNYAI
jgi:hypothetical protein